MERSIDAIIREAIAQGKFDDLPGKGRPLPTDVNDGTPAEYRLAFAMLKNAGYVPQEAQWMNDVAALKEQLAATADPEERTRLSREIQNLQLKVTLFLESLRGGR